MINKESHYEIIRAIVLLWLVIGIIFISIASIAMWLVSRML